MQQSARRISWRHVPALLIGCLLLPGAACALDAYVISHPEASIDRSKSYGRLLLRAALEASRPQYGPYTVSVSPVVMERVRLLSAMEQGDVVNVSIQSTTPEWEHVLTPIRIPVDKGLESFRIALIDGRRQSAFSGIATLAQLRQFSVGVGTQWVTRDIYQRGGLPVVTGDNHAGLYGMLMDGRFDYLPRTVEEAFLELAEQRPHYPDMAVEKSFILYSLSPRYFFVSPHTPRLAERLRAGLEKLIESGEFDRLFMAYYGPLIARAHLCTRAIFRISNPDMDLKAPLQRSRLWFDPFEAGSGALGCQAGKRAGQ